MKKIACLAFWIVFLVSAPLIADDITSHKHSMRGDWREIFARPGITVYSQKLPKSGLLAFRADALLEAPVGQVMEVLRRVDITDEWMPDTREKYILQVNSDLDVITYSLNHVPFPFADRELVLRNHVHLDKDRKYLVLDIYSVEFDGQPVKKGAVRSHMQCGEMNV